MIGRPPSQVDFLTSLPGPENFEEAWEKKEDADLGGFTIFVLGMTHLISAKQNAGRPQDLADLDELQRASASDGNA